MRVSLINNDLHKNNIAFSGDDNNKNKGKEINDFLKKAGKTLKSNPDEKTAKEYIEKMDEYKKWAEEQLKEQNKKVPGLFVRAFKWFGKINKTGNKAIDTASMLTRVVLWGNVGKEAVGTTLYTVQALTNQDLPEDKRKFVGMYDLVVGLVSTAFSFIFGVGLESKIKKGYKKILKPLSEAENQATKSKAGAAIVGLAAFSSFFLQTIIGKRIVAPAVGTPMAGKLRSYMEEREAAQRTEKEKKAKGQVSPIPADALVLAKTSNIKIIATKA